MSSEMLDIETNGILIKFKDKFQASDFSITLQISEKVDLLYLSPNQYEIDSFGLGVWIRGSTEIDGTFDIKVRTLVSWGHINTISIIEEGSPRKLPKNRIGFL